MIRWNSRASIIIALSPSFLLLKNINFYSARSQGHCFFAKQSRNVRCLSVMFHCGLKTDHWMLSTRKDLAKQDTKLIWMQTHMHGYSEGKQRTRCWRKFIRAKLDLKRHEGSIVYWWENLLHCRFLRKWKIKYMHLKQIIKEYHATKMYESVSNCMWLAYKPLINTENVIINLSVILLLSQFSDVYVIVCFFGKYIEYYCA